MESDGGKSGIRFTVKEWRTATIGRVDQKCMCLSMAAMTKRKRLSRVLLVVGIKCIVSVYFLKHFLKRKKKKQFKLPKHILKPPRIS